MAWAGEFFFHMETIVFLVAVVAMAIVLGG
jgi:hypothetical protein